MKGEAPGHTLQATARVHEVYLKLAKPTEKTSHTGGAEGMID
jgi:hypothetical protein